MVIFCENYNFTTILKILFKLGVWAEHILAGCMELHLQSFLISLVLFESMFCNHIRVKITGKPWGTCWVMLTLDRKCSGLFCHQIPQEDHVCPPRRTLGHCLHQAPSVMCITLASTMYDQLKRCFALFIPYKTLTSGKKMFQSGCKRVLCFFWHTSHTSTPCHSETEKNPLHAKTYEKGPSKKSPKG